MKVLQVNCVYNAGSTGKITHDLHHYLLEQGVESVVYYGRGKRTDEPGVTKICSEFYGKANNVISRVRGTMYGGCYLSTWRLIRHIKKEKPDIVHLQCINGYFVNIYRLLSWLKKSGIKTVLTLHAEFMYTGNCGHALDCEKWKMGCGDCPRLRQETKSLLWDGTARSFQKMKQAYAGFEKNLTVVSVSPWLRDRAKESLMMQNMHHRVILNGVDTDVFIRRRDNSVRERHQIAEDAIVFHATPHFSDNPSHLKGGYYVLELAKRMPDVRFLIAGTAFVQGSVPKNVTLLGQISDRELLAEYYSAADVTIITSKRETFSMVCAESLCCGTPVAGFLAGGPEMISLFSYSSFVPQGDLQGLEAETRRWIMMREEERVHLGTLAQKHYANRQMLENYLEVYRGIHDEALC